MEGIGYGEEEKEEKEMGGGELGGVERGDSCSYCFQVYKVESLIWIQDCNCFPPAVKAWK